MTKKKLSPGAAAVKEWLAADGEELREVVRAWLQETLEQEMTEAVGASKGERTPARLGYRSEYYVRTLVTPVGKLELRVTGAFRPKCLSATSSRRRR